METEVEPRKCANCSRPARFERALCVACAASNDKSNKKYRLKNPEKRKNYTRRTICRGCGAHRIWDEPCVFCE